MLLAVDAGNTQTTLALFSGDKAVAHWRIATDAKLTADELRIKLWGLLASDVKPGAVIDDVVIASVVPTLTNNWVSAAVTITGKSPLLINSTIDTGVGFTYGDPHELGADRIANAAGALAKVGAPAIVVDFGTATNIDVIDKDGNYCGGVLIPGIGISSTALFQRAAKLASVNLHMPEKTIGTTTGDALRSGIVLGTAVQIEGLISRIRLELGDLTTPVIATGGLASLISEATTVFTYVDDGLTLEGMRLIYNRIR